MNEDRSCPSKEALVSALYGEASLDQRHDLDRHLDACAACRDEYESMASVRLALQEWSAPVLPVHFRLVAEPDPVAGPGAAILAGPTRWWQARRVMAAGLAAAAVLVLGASAGLANLDVTIGAQGLTVRTGRAREAGRAVPATGEEPAAAGQDPIGLAGPAAQAGASPADWRAEFAALERRLRDEMDDRVASSAAGPTAQLASTRAAGQDLLRQVQALIDAAELRQQRNLAQRVTELAREFDVQRRTDLVTIQQGLGQLEGRTQAEAARTRELMNLMVRTSGGTLPR